MNAKFHGNLLCRLIGDIVLNGLQDGRQFISQEYGNDRGRRLIRPETVVISGSRHGQSQKILIIVHSLNHCT